MNPDVENDDGDPGPLPDYAFPYTPERKARIDQLRQSDLDPATKLALWLKMKEEFISESEQETP